MWTQKLATGKSRIPDTVSNIRVGRSLLLVHFRREKLGEALIAQNPDYCFVLSKQAGQEGRGWSLSQFSDEKEVGKNPVLRSVQDTDISRRLPLSAVLVYSPEEFKSLPGLEIL